MGARFSGSELRGFTEGWARAAFQGNGHYFALVNGALLSACGFVAFFSEAVPVFGVGTMPTCRKCERAKGPPTDRTTFVEDMKP